jgi:hypothetical protein
MGATQHDKKVVGGNVVGVWPVRIGDVVIRPLAQRHAPRGFARSSLLHNGASRPCERPSTMASNVVVAQLSRR